MLSHLTQKKISLLLVPKDGVNLSISAEYKNNVNYLQSNPL